mgnify:CR=1 FL=1
MVPIKRQHHRRFRWLPLPFTYLILVHALPHPKISTSSYVLPCHVVPVWKVWKHAVSDIRYLGTNLDYTAANICAPLHFRSANMRINTNEIMAIAMIASFG